MGLANEKIGGVRYMEVTPADGSASYLGGREQNRTDGRHSIGAV